MDRDQLMRELSQLYPHGELSRLQPDDSFLSPTPEEGDSLGAILGWIMDKASSLEEYLGVARRLQLAMREQIEREQIEREAVAETMREQPVMDMIYLDDSIAMITNYNRPGDMPLLPECVRIRREDHPDGFNVRVHFDQINPVRHSGLDIMLTAADAGTLGANLVQLVCGNPRESADRE
jgi:hypothetical protein